MSVIVVVTAAALMLTALMASAALRLWTALLAWSFHALRLSLRRGTVLKSLLRLRAISDSLLLLRLG